MLSLLLRRAPAANLPPAEKLRLVRRVRTLADAAIFLEKEEVASGVLCWRHRGLEGDVEALEQLLEAWVAMRGLDSRP